MRKIKWDYVVTQTIFWLGVVLLLISTLWIYFEPGFEPVTVFVGAIIALLGSWAVGNRKGEESRTLAQELRNRQQKIDYFLNMPKSGCFCGGWGGYIFMHRTLMEYLSRR